MFAGLPARILLLALLNPVTLILAGPVPSTDARAPQLQERSPNQYYDPGPLNDYLAVVNKGGWGPEQEEALAKYQAANYGVQGSYNYNPGSYYTPTGNAAGDRAEAERKRKEAADEAARLAASQH